MNLNPETIKVCAEKIKESLGSLGYYCETRQQNKGYWEAFYSLLEHQPVSLSNSYIDYQIEYERGNGRLCADLSILIGLENQAIAIWPISINTNEDCAYLTSFDKPAMAPFFANGINQTSKDKITKNCYRLLLALAAKLGQRDLTTYSYDFISSSLSCWHIYAMQQGASSTLRHEAIIDLSESFERIKQSFRKSYKNLINKSEKLWKARIFTSTNIESVWDDFVALHLLVAGRTTRSTKTWEIQKNAVLNDNAFLVALYDGEGDCERLIGGGYFLFSKDEGSYGVGAYDRKLFDQPVSHIIQIKAIQELRKRGCKIYHIGRVDFPGESSSTTNKQLSISFFKSGFANKFSPSFYCNKPIGQP